MEPEDYKRDEAYDLWHLKHKPIVSRFATE